jgi:predicted ester cyclase
MQGFMEGMGSMFSDITGEVTHVLVDGDYVFVRGEYSATHTGEAFGIPATGAKVHFDAYDLHHLQDGKITKTWHLENFMSIYNQLQEAAA